MSLFAALGVIAAGLAGLGWLLRTTTKFVRRLLGVTDVILGSDKHQPLADRLDALEASNQAKLDRLDAIEHEVKTNNGSSLRDVADRVEQLASQTERRLAGMHASMIRSTTESKKRRLEDREVLARLEARVDAMWEQTNRRKGQR